MNAYWSKRNDILRSILKNKGFDGIQYQNHFEGSSTKPSYIAFSPEQIKRVDNLNPTADPDIRYSERNYDDQGMPTPRGILAGAFGEVAKTQAERDKVQAYRKQVGLFDRLDMLLIDEKNRLRELQRNKAPAADIADTQAAIADLTQKLDAADRTLLSLQNAQPLRDILGREREAIQKAAKVKMDERIAKVKERNQEYRERLKQRYSDKATERIDAFKDRSTSRVVTDRIDQNAKKMLQWLTKPDTKKYVPEHLRTAVADLLGSLDMAWTTKAGEEITSKRSRSWQEAMKDLANRMQNADAIAATAMKEDGGSSSFQIDLDPDLVADITALTEGGDAVVRYRDLPLDKLQSLDSILRRVSHTISNANKFHSNARYSNLAELAGKSVDHLQAIRQKRLYGNAFDRISSALNIDMADAFTYFDSLGPDARVVLDALYKGGFGKLVENTKQAQAFFEELNKRYKAFGLAKWSGKDAIAQTFEVQGGQLVMTPGQIMELYLLNKRDQARGHIYGKGIRVENAKARLDGRKTNLQQDGPVRVTEADVNRIISTLSSEQLQAAEDFANFLADTSTKWGNEVSMILYGYNKFTEQNYYPIRSDQDYTNTKDPSDFDNLYALLNLGMTKATVAGANNAIVVGDVFDTITRHITDMANYNAFAVPLSDAMKWFNFKREGADAKGNPRMESVKSSIRRAHGADAQNYFVNLMKAINGIRNPQTAQGFHGLVSSAMSKFKRSAVAGNVRVIMQQHGSVARATMMMNPLDIVAAYTMSPRRGMAMAQKYSPIAAWKAMGYYDMNIGRSMTDLISGRVGAMDKFTEATMMPAGAMDNFTLGILWNAVQREVGRTYEGDKTSEDFYRKVGDRLTDVIDRTQVVDTVFHRSQAMRDKDGLMKMSTNFMSEPIKGYNMMMNAIRSKDAGQIARAGVVHLTNAIIVALLAGLWDGFRDEEKDKGLAGYWDSVKANTFGIGGEFMKSNVWDNINPMNMVPFVKEAYSIVFDGYSPSRPDMQAIQRIKWAYNDWNKLFNGEYNGSTKKLALKTASALSTVTGVPIGSILRDVVALWQTLDPRVVVGDGGVPAKLAYQRFATAIENNEMDKALELYQAIIQSGKDAAAATTGVAGELKKDEKIIATAQAKKDGDFTAYEAGIAEAVQAGFPKDVVIRTINSLLAEKGEKEPMVVPETYEEMMEQLGYSTSTYTYSYADVAGLYDAGNTKEIKRVTKLLIEEGRKESDIITGVQNIYKAAYAEGTLTKDQVTKKLKGIKPGMTTNELYKLFDRWDYSIANPGADYSVYDRFREAVRTGRDLRKVVTEYTDKRKYGYEPSTLKSEITSHFKEEYIKLYKQGRASSLKGYLINAYVMLGDTREQASKKIDAWLKDK